MTDLTKIEKPFMFCTEKEQVELTALIGVSIGVSYALQILSAGGDWLPRGHRVGKLEKGCIYRQNPDWNPPKLDVPDWFWKNSTFNWAIMDSNGYLYLCDMEPRKDVSGWGMQFGAKRVRLDKAFNKMFKPHNFNPHNVPWDKSLTKRPEGKLNG